jgi:glucokinase
MIVAIDVGGTKISGGIITEEGVIKNFVKEATRKEGGYIVVKQVAQIIENLVKNIRGLNSVVGIGLSIPGIVNNDTVIMAPNIKDWENIHLIELLSLELKNEIPIVLVDDRISATLGEYWLGAARNSRNAVVIIIGTGVGAGIIIDGKPYSGSNEVAGAIGWWLTDHEELVKETFKGFLEEKVAGPAIARKAIIELKRQGETASEVLARMCQHKIDEITSEMVFDAAKQGDPLSIRIVEEVVEYVGMAVSNVVSVLDPEVVVIGGGVGKALVNYSKKIEDIVKRFSQPYAAKKVKIAFSELGDRACLLGAAKYVLEKCGKNK